MADRDLILGVLAAQAGFVTPAQVMAAASARMLARDGRSLLDHLVDSGALSPERRDLVTTLANEALAANGGSPERVLDSLPGARALSRTLVSELSAQTRPGSPSVEELVPLERDGQYARLDELGRGGQSIVWRALDRFVGREVALKELTPPGPGDSPGVSGGRARFLREARLTAQLDHPGIATILELAHRPDGTLYAAQKLVRGRTLKAALAHCRTLGQRLELLPHLLNAAQTMAYAHARAVVHRDLKPSNVMVGEYGETVVVDWGLAKRRGEPEPAKDLSSPDLGPELTQAGVALGTPSYMSPEQARGDLQAIDERSDVFGLGAMLYELLTGRPPFQGADNAQVIDAVLSGRLIPIRELCPDAPPELAAIAERALRSDPSQRYVDAGAFASELLVYQAGGRVEAYPYRPLELIRKFVKRNRGLSAAIAASVLILIGGVVAVALQLRQARVNLASALIERARRAEDLSDWARAAAYYAASRVQNDTAAARWGIALAREKMPERGTVLNGEPGAFTDVDVLPDGTVVALENGRTHARLYEVASGRTHWTARTEEPIKTARISGESVRLSVGHFVRVLDQKTGAERFRSDRNRERICRSGPATRRARVDFPGVLHLEGIEDPRIEVELVYPCAISPAGDRMAFRDRQGLVRLWDLEAGREVTSRPAPDAQEIDFTGHGVVLVRAGSLQVFGGAEGDFSIELPGRSASGRANPSEGRALAVSGDGHRVVVDSPALNRAEVVDLRDRSVFVSFSRPPGTPSYAFSPDGSTLYAAGLPGGSTLISWKLRRPAPSASGSFRSQFGLWMVATRFLVYDSNGLELRSDDGTLLRTGTVPEFAGAGISGDGSTLLIGRPAEIIVQRADDGQELARLPCESCWAAEISNDGRRVMGMNAQRRRVWDVRVPSLLLDEPMGSDTTRAWHGFSQDGTQIGRFEEGALVLHELSGGSKRRLPVPDSPNNGAGFSPDGTRVVISFPGRIGVWTLRGLDPVWTISHLSSLRTSVDWSANGSIIIVTYEGAGAVLLDARSGEELARIYEGRSGSAAPEVNVHPGLRFRMSRTDRSWQLFPLPGPDTSSPAESFRRALDETGFQMRGVELEVASP
jgi:serine/threonine protein kinase/WD40 repeat protein